MRKSTILSGGLFVLLAAVVFLQDFVCPHPAKDKLYSDFGHWLDQNVFGDRKIAERHKGLQRFVRVADAAEAEVIAGKMDLENGVARILAACEEHFPEHLEYLATVEIGDSHEERIARKLIRHVDEDERVNRDEALRERLLTELTELLRKRQQRSTTPAHTVSV